MSIIVNLSNQEKLLADWFRRARESQFCHYECATWYGRWHLFIGVPSIILSAVVTTAVFTSVESKNSGTSTLVVGIISAISVVLTSLQTFLNFSSLSNQHRSIAASYGVIRRKIEYLMVLSEALDRTEKIDEIREQLDDLAREAPAIPHFLKRKFEKKIKD